jgi:hypothetical protein
LVQVSAYFFAMMSFMVGMGDRKKNCAATPGRPSLTDPIPTHDSSSHT